MNLVIDIGNTRVKYAWFDGGKIIESFSAKEVYYESFERMIHNTTPDHIIISSVKLPDEKLSSLIQKYAVPVIILNHTTPLPVTIEYKTPETLGRDRIAAIAGAKLIFPNKNILVIDMGTAITIDFLGFSGIFSGGNISPGFSLRFRALNEFTSQLPLVKADNLFPLSGTDTISAISAGVQNGILFELTGYMDIYSEKYPDCIFLFTGGDSEFFVPKLKRTIFVDSDLVLKGLNYILEYNKI